MPETEVPEAKAEPVTAPVAEVVAEAPVAAAPVADVVAAAVAAAVAAERASAQAKIAEVEARLSAEVEAREVKDVIAFVEKTYANLPGAAAEVGPALRVLRKADAKAAATIEAILASTNALLASGKPSGLEPVGSAGEAQPKSADSRLNEIVADLRAKDKTLSVEKARVLAYEQNPDLYAALSGGKE